jgi:DNA-binding CsgD family transcriptional regulator
MSMEAAEIVGREGELTALRTFLDEPLPAAFVLDGGPGIGKTTLWRAGVKLARAADYRVLACAPAESEAQLSFAALRDLFDDVFEEVERELPEPQRQALAAALLRAEWGAGREGAVRAAVARVVGRLAARGPVLIAADDIQWLDGPSASALEFAFRRLGERRVAILVGRRTDDVRPAPLGLARAFPEASVRVVGLHGLALGALHRLLRTRLGITVPRRVLVRVHEASGGNPFYALELARALGGRLLSVPPMGALPLTPALRDLLERRLAAAPPAVQELLLLCSALPAPTLAAVANRGAESSAVEAAIDLELLATDGERLRFAHPLIASAVSERTPGKRKRTLYRRLADLAEDPEERAMHLSHAAVSPDEATAAAIERGADLAYRRGAVETAGWLATEARRLTPSDEESEVVRRDLKVCEYLRPLGSPDEVERTIAELVARAAPGPLRARALYEAASKTENVEEKLRLCDDALAEAGIDADLRARLHAQRSRALEGAGRLDEAARIADEALEAADLSGDPELAVRSIARVGRLRFQTGGGLDRRLMTRGLELEQRVDVFLAYHSASSSLADQLMWSDQLTESRRLFEQLVARAENAGATNSLVALHLQLAEVENRAAGWLAADAHAREGLELAREVEHGSIQAPLLFQQAVAQAHLGRIDDAFALLGEAEAISRATSEALYELSYASLHGFIALSRGDAAMSCERLAPLPGRAAAMGVRDPGFLHLVPNVVEAFVAAGRLDEATAEIDRLEQLGGAARRSRALAFAARGRALVAAARGDTDAATSALDAAFGHQRDVPDPFEHARTLLVLGIVHRRAQHKRDARDALEQAHQRFEALGAALWAVKARAEAARVGGRAPSGAALTPTERRIAELVAEGRSNRDVAAIVFVTPKTVDVYLSRIYAKLGVHSRTALARRLFEEANAGKL